MTDIPPTPRPRWRLSFQQLRLGILMSALVLGITGMSRNDPRMVNVAIGIALIGVVMRIVGRLRDKGALSPRKEGTGDE